MSTNPAWAGKTIDFVIDLDGTLIDLWEADMRYSPQIEASGLKFRVIDGAAEFIQCLLDIPDSRISFFSAGLEERNIEFLKKLRLPSGISAYEAVEGRVLSRDQITSPNGTKSLFGKDLRKIGKDVDLERTILIDDQLGYSLEGQERNLLWLPDQAIQYGGHPLYSFFKVRNKLVCTDMPDSRGHEKFSDRNRLVRAMGQIDWMLERIEQDKISPVEALDQQQWKRTPLTTTYESHLVNDLSLLLRGYRRFKRSNRGYDPILYWSLETPFGERFDRQVEIYLNLLAQAGG